MSSSPSAVVLYIEVLSRNRLESNSFHCGILDLRETR